MSEMDPRYKTNFLIEIDSDPNILKETSILEVTLIESLLTPSVQTRMTVQSYRHIGQPKDLDQLAGHRLRIMADRELLALDGQESTFDMDHPIYKVSERIPLSYQLDEYTITACHDTLLTDASRRVSRSWRCTTPSSIVSDVLNQCIGAENIDIGPASPKRTYIAENIHPFQVITQQTDVALDGGNDPSFLHYMTFKNNGTHHFRSLYDLTRRSPYKTGGLINRTNSNPGVFQFKEKGAIDLTFGDPYSILKYEFPCDFDILAELLNGFDIDGQPKHSLLVLNPFNGIHSILGGDNSGCGMGGQQFDTAFTNKDSAQEEGNCEIQVEKYKLNREARLRLLETEMVAVRLTLGFNPNLHAGMMIEVEIPNKIINPDGSIQMVPDYGSGHYLISSVTHNLIPSGFSTTVVDCVSKAVGNGMTRG